MKLILLIACYVNAILAVQKLNVLYEWKYVDYVWDSPQQKNEAIKNGEYNKEGIQMIDVDVAKDGRVFVTNLRLPGAPASVSTVTKRQGEGGPLLKPYPNWSWYKKGDCNGITSAFRVAIDACNRLYILDTGSIGVKHVCPAQILIFDLKTNELVNRIKIPDNVAQNRTGDGLLITPIVQTRGPNCALESIYLADAVGKGLVIVKSPRHQYRMESKVFEPEELYANISVAGKNFYLPDSLFGLALTTPDPKYGETDPELYLRPLASRSLYSASSKLLDLSLQGNAVGFSGNPSMMPSQATGMAFSEDGTLFFGLTKEIAIACWNRHKPMDPSNIEIVAQDDKTLQFTGTVKVVPKERSAKGCEELITLSNTYQNLATGTRKYDEVNFRILSGSVQHLVQGTKCTPPKAAFNPAPPNVRRGPAYYGYYFR